jgi:hypothetical protein
MTTDFTRANPALEKAIAEAKTKEDLDAVLLRWQELNGMATRYDRAGLPGSAGTSSSQPQPEAVPQEVGRSLRKAITLDDGTIKLIEADSFYGLDILENALRGKRI